MRWAGKKQHNRTPLRTGLKEQPICKSSIKNNSGQGNPCFHAPRKDSSACSTRFGEPVKLSDQFSKGKQPSQCPKHLPLITQKFIFLNLALLNLSEHNHCKAFKPSSPKVAHGFTKEGSGLGVSPSRSCVTSI